MVAGPMDNRPFIPAPFAVYVPDALAGRLARWRALAAVLCVLAALLPGVAGPSTELALPVFYARVELERRAPVVLILNLPGEEYAVQPASLGYFTADGEFVFSAEVPRGLIYGRNNGELLVVEVTTPEMSELYIDQQLQLIRERVTELNEHDNLLMQARREAPPARNDAQKLAKRFWDLLGPELTGPVPPEWLEQVEWQYTGDPLELEAALTDQARHRARLKRLYYESQAARLNLLLAQYDLQIALARMPSPEIDELLSLGDADLVSRTMLGEIDRLRTAWSERRDLLAHQAAGNLQLLEGAEAGSTVIPDNPLDALLETVHNGVVLDQAPGLARTAGQGIGPARAMACRAQLVVATAEARMIEERLAELDTATRHVELGVVPPWTSLPRYAPRLKLLRMAGLEKLDAFALAEHAASDPRTAVELLLALDRVYESPEGGVPDAGERPGDGLAELAGQVQADAVAYGLLVVDRCRTGLVPSRPGMSPPEDAGQELIDGLAEVLAEPDAWGAAGLDLGYLEFMYWYAGLEQEQDRQVFTRTATAGDGDTAVEPGPDDAGHGANVDELLN